MTRRQNIILYVVVDENGDYAAHEDSFDEAVERYNEGHDAALTGYYTLQVSVPIRPVDSVTIKATVPDTAQPGDSTPISGQVLMVKPPE